MSSLAARRDETPDTCPVPTELILRPKDTECCLTGASQLLLIPALYLDSSSNAQSAQGQLPRNANVRGESVASRLQDSNFWFMDCYGQSLTLRAML